MICLILYVTTESGSDFMAFDMDISFESGQATKNVDIPIINDDISEPIEQFTLRLTQSANSPNFASIGFQNEHTITIKDDDSESS